MVLACTRWWLLVQRPLLAPHLTPRWLVWLLLVVQLDAMSNLAHASREFLDGGPMGAAGLFLAAAMAIMIDEAPFVRVLILSRRVAHLVRQPVPPWVLGPGATLLVGLVAAPVAGVAALVHRQPLPALTWWLLALPPLALMAARHRLLALSALGLAAGIIALGHVHPGLHALLLPVVCLAVVPSMGAIAFAWPEPYEAPPRALGWRPRRALTGMVHRDLAVLWRTHRGLVIGPALAAPVVGWLVAAARVNGPYEGWTLAGGIEVGLLCLGPLALTVTSSLAIALGRQLDPPCWPTTSLVRASALALIAAVPLVPAWAAASVCGAPALRLAQHAGLSAFVAAIATGAAAFVALRPLRADHGIFPWYLALTLAMALVGGPFATTFLALGALTVTSRALEARRHRS